MSKNSILFIVLSLIIIVNTQIGCKNEKGKTVEWWIAVKQPQLEEGKSKLVQAGEAYVFMDSESRLSEFQMSNIAISSKTSLIGRTVQQIYTSSPSSVGRILYSDQTPNTTSSHYAHAKGILLFNSKEGFWLVHSTPRFPNVYGIGEYSFPESGKKYGQSFFCISVNSVKQVESIATQLRYFNAQIYDKHLPAGIEPQFPITKALMEKKNVIREPTYSIGKIPSATAAFEFIHFSKTAQWGKDIFQDLISPFLRDMLYIQSWMRPITESCCPNKCSYANINVLYMKFIDVGYKQTSDHSKWLISSSKNHLVCIGDINRMESQKKRGGGFLCIRNRNVWNAFKASIMIEDSCSLNRTTSVVL